MPTPLLAVKFTRNRVAPSEVPFGPATLFSTTTLRTGTETMLPWVLLAFASWKKTWTRSGVKVAGSTGRSKVTTNALACGEPSPAVLEFTVSLGPPTGPCVLEMIRGPAGMSTEATLVPIRCLPLVSPFRLLAQIG